MAMDSEEFGGEISAALEADEAGGEAVDQGDAKLTPDKNE